MAWFRSTKAWDQYCYFYYRYLWRRNQKLRKFLLRWAEQILLVIAAIGLVARAALPEVKTIQSGWLTILIMVAALLSVPALILKKRAQSLDRQREALFLINIAELQRELERTILPKGSDRQNEIRLQTFVTTVLRVFFSTLNLKQGLDVTLMLFEPDKDCLTLWEQYGTGPPVDSGFTARPGSSGAGICFERKMPVYIPDRLRCHGLLLNIARLAASLPTFSVLRNAYESVSGKEYEVFRSILSVPVLPATGREKPYGVLNFDSPAVDPFDEIDFKMAVHFGQVLGMAICRMESR